MPIERIVSRINDFNANKRFGQTFDVVALGHWHLPLSLQLSKYAFFINGALVPASGYAQEFGMHGATGQWLWESTEKHLVGDRRLILIGEEEDNDSSLDKILRPVNFQSICDGLPDLPVDYKWGS